MYFIMLPELIFYTFSTLTIIFIHCHILSGLIRLCSRLDF